MVSSKLCSAYESYLRGAVEVSFIRNFNFRASSLKVGILSSLMTMCRTLSSNVCGHLQHCWSEGQPPRQKFLKPMLHSTFYHYLNAFHIRWLDAAVQVVKQTPNDILWILPFVFIIIRVTNEGSVLWTCFYNDCYSNSRLISF